MKKGMVIILAALVVMGLSAGLAIANGDNGDFHGWYEAEGSPKPGHSIDLCYHGAYYKLVNEKKGWDYTCNGIGTVGKGGCHTGNDGYTVVWEKYSTYALIPFTVEASVAQWVQVNFRADKIMWRITKPGTYTLPQDAAVALRFKSNGDLVVTPMGFQNLQSTQGEPEKIKVWYAIYNTTTGWNANWGTWSRPKDFNQHFYNLQEDQEHKPLDLLLRMKIKVTECISACEYKDEACFKVILCEQKWWMKKYLCD